MGAFVAAAGACPEPCLAKGTVAGTDIINIASVSFTDSKGSVTTLQSNPAAFLVDEVLDLAISSRDAGDMPVSPGDMLKPLTFSVLNAGNGAEPVILKAHAAVSGDQFDPIYNQLVIDSNGNGIYDPGVDQRYVEGTNNPVLVPDQSVTVFLLSDIPAGLKDKDRGIATLEAIIKKGTGPAGTILPGQGPGSGNAVIGLSTGSVSAKGAYVASLVQSDLQKTQTILDPAGSNRPVSGAIVTYTLIAHVHGSGTLAAADIRDMVPAHTTYVVGSLVLDGKVLTDVVDSDAGMCDGTIVKFALGDVTAPATHTASFKVKIN